MNQAHRWHLRLPHFTVQVSEAKYIISKFLFTDESEPVFTHAISFKPNEPENGQKAREQLELLGMVNF